MKTSDLKGQGEQLAGGEDRILNSDKVLGYGRQDRLRSGTRRDTSFRRILARRRLNESEPLEVKITFASLLLTPDPCSPTPAALQLRGNVGGK
jgi:hypothetical protein